MFFRPWMQSRVGCGSGGGGGHVSGSGTGDDEAPKDPGARITHQSYTEKDYEGELIRFFHYKVMQRIYTF